MDKDTLYARWLNNELSDSEIQELKASGDWDILRAIVDETDTWKLPEVSDQQIKSIRTRIDRLKNKRETKVIPINRWTWAYRAASVAVIFSLVYWFFFRQDIFEYQNLEGNIATIQLPDSTEVRLIGRSRIQYDKKNFARARKVKLNGQVHLAVRKKGEFVASFDGGEVQVLGTQFEVMTGKTVSRVKCFEGRVKVLVEGKPESILNPGDGVRYLFNETSGIPFTFEEEAPEWFGGESIFNNAPLEEVIEALQIQYHVDIDATNIDVKRKYSGKFRYDDLPRSLEMVFSPMGIQYTIEGTTNKKISLQ